MTGEQIWYQSFLTIHDITLIFFLIFFSYKREFGFIIENRNIIVDDIRVRGIGKSVIAEEAAIPQCEGEPIAEMVNILCFKYYNVNVVFFK